MQFMWEEVLAEALNSEEIRQVRQSEPGRPGERGG